MILPYCQTSKDYEALTTLSEQWFIAPEFLRDSTFYWIKCNQGLFRSSFSNATNSFSNSFRIHLVILKCMCSECYGWELNFWKLKWIATIKKRRWKSIEREVFYNLWLHRPGNVPLQVFIFTHILPYGIRKHTIMDLWYVSKLYLYCWSKYS